MLFVAPVKPKLRKYKQFSVIEEKHDLAKK